MSKISPLNKARAAYLPVLPMALASDPSTLSITRGQASSAIADGDKIKNLFAATYGQPEVSFGATGGAIESKPLRVGVVLSGGQAPGGHNVISGIFDGLKRIHPDSELIGFLGGPSGITDNKFLNLTSEIIDQYRNTGGFDIIASGRTKLETEEQFDACVANMKALAITTLVVIGGDDSNTNAAVLAEYFKEKESGISVIGCPKTIDGDLKNDKIEISFGFDTATKTYAELIGNIQRDCISAKKYWHFIKLMGRSASHIALECGLKTAANLCLISEEIESRKQSLDQVVTAIAQIVADRSKAGKDYGVALVPEGLVEFIPEIKALIAELNEMLARESRTFDALSSDADKIHFVSEKLGVESKTAFASLPRSIQAQLLADRDPHGNVQVSRIETEKLLIEAVGARLSQWKKDGSYAGKFSGLGHFFGYEGRAAFPSNFDANYCYALGVNASFLAGAGLTGYISSVQGLSRPAKDWKAGGVPLTSMMNIERRHGLDKPVIKKALVELDGPVFKTFAAIREQWAKNDDYEYPGAIQYWGPPEVSDLTTETLKLESK